MIFESYFWLTSPMLTLVIMSHIRTLQVAPGQPRPGLRPESGNYLLVIFRVISESHLNWWQFDDTQELSLPTTINADNFTWSSHCCHDDKSLWPDIWGILDISITIVSSGQNLKLLQAPADLQWPGPGVSMSEESSARHSISDCPRPACPARAVQVYTHCP